MKPANKEGSHLCISREEIAAMAMQGLLASNQAINIKPLVQISVEYADALIAELSKEGE